MRRTFLLWFLIFSLCQGLWHDGRELQWSMEKHEYPGIREAIPFGETLSVPRPTQRFVQILAAVEQALLHPRFQRQELSKHPVTAWLPTSRGQDRRSDEAMHPREWGLIVLRLPRSDG